MKIKEVFRVDYPSGYIEVNVGVFFGSADQKRIKKFLRIARQHCSDEQRRGLVSAMRMERFNRECTLTKLTELERKREEILHDYYEFVAERPLTSYEKNLTKQRDKLDVHIESLEKERWQR